MGMKMVVKTGDKYCYEDAKPVYGDNYKRGYIGFTFNPSSPVSNIIVKCTKYWNYSAIPISHVLIVENEETCIEALMGKDDNKVVRSTLSKYFDSEQLIFFRKPKDIDEASLNTITETAVSSLGSPYETKQLFGQIIRAGFFTRTFNKITNNVFADCLSNLIDDPKAFICSELAAYCLKSAKNWEYHDKGILKRSTCRVNPIELFEDRTIFKDWNIE